MFCDLFISFSFKGQVTFKESNEKNVKKVVLGERNVTINWDYNLEDPNALRSIDFSYLNDKGKRVNLAYKRKGQNFSFYQDLPAEMENNFIIEVDDTSVARLTFKSVFLNYNNTKFTFDIHLQSGTEVSSHVTLIIMGKLI